MNLMSRTITGSILLIFGICMTLAGLFVFVTLPYGIIAIVLGAVILMNKNEDKIERIKKHKGGSK
jgi:membrane-bound ClpP family serine protease